MRAGADCLAAGCVAETREEEAARVLRSASRATREAFESATRAARHETRSVREVDGCKRAAAVAVRSAVTRGELTAAEGATLAQHAQHVAHTSFGTRHERSAVEEYEATTANSVRDGNNAMWTWPFSEAGAMRAPSVQRSRGDRCARSERRRLRVRRRVERFAACDAAELALPAALDSRARREAHLRAEQSLKELRARSVWEEIFGAVLL